ncbi:MAG: FAA hydrolase family protein [Gammaproteobacteria bacterium]|nr:MAG: FAA hydrolase family protein [Gammaproteobacteria bacterium]
MKLVRFGERDRELPGLLDADGGIRDLSGHIADLKPSELQPQRLAALARIDPRTLPLVPPGQRLGVPVRGIGKIICVGLNYRDHAAETAMTVPTEPLLFMKATTALNGPTDPIVFPPGSRRGDWEVELGAIIGQPAREVPESGALDYVAGYCVTNDVSERELQLEHGGQWVKGKSNDTFAPVGPWLVTPDEIADLQALDLWTEVNGHRYQDGNTRDMIFGVAALVSYISRFMTLVPGDLIMTGTPPGVGLGQSPPVHLRDGDRVRVGIAGLGEQLQDVHVRV